MTIRSIEGGVEGVGKSLGGNPKGAEAAGKGASFADTLKASMDEVNGLQHDADRAIEALVKGEDTSLHETMLAVEKADLSFKVMMQVRNKLLEAYREVMRTPM
ncbi:MAG: flagellar hook-basal body complex protein FliE [Myxococcales bacterium]|nr:flagellar hook-basal body complex protein FliE [Myxococcales bacterium]